MSQSGRSQQLQLEGLQKKTIHSFFIFTSRLLPLPPNSMRMAVHFCSTVHFGFDSERPFSENVR